MKLSIQSQSLIESTLKEALKRLPSDTEQAIVTDIHLMPKQSSGEFCVLNDDEEELAKTIVEEWAECEDERFYESVERMLRPLLGKIKDENLLEKVALFKPYSFVLVDENCETVAELLLVDDDTMLVDDELLKGLDQELDEFLKELLKD